VIIETQITDGSPLAGRLVSEVTWPREAVLVAIERDRALVVPRGDLRLLAGDHVSIFATPAARAAVEGLFDPPRIGSTAEPGELLMTAAESSEG
jgi:trk system potassium uptake protein TrkA